MKLQEQLNKIKSVMGLNEDIITPDLTYDYFLKRVPFFKKYNNVSNSKHVGFQKISYNSNITMHIPKNEKNEEKIYNIPNFNIISTFTHSKNKLNDKFQYIFNLENEIIVTKPENMDELFYRVFTMATKMIADKSSYNKEIIIPDDKLPDNILDEIFNNINKGLFELEHQIETSTLDLKNPLDETTNKPNILTEKLMDVDDDVDYLYNTFFKDIIEGIRQNKTITPDMVSKQLTNTGVLLSELSVKAHELNPCTIILFNKLNVYEPGKRNIYITISPEALYFLLEKNGNYKDAYNSLYDEDKPTFENDLSEARVKGSIHHELTHWIDDTLNNKHIYNLLRKSSLNPEYGNKRLKYINVHPLEIQAQIHNIKQLYRYYKNTWDEMSFEEMLNKNPSFYFLQLLPNDVKATWKKNMLKRMNREGLLGKNMK